MSEIDMIRKHYGDFAGLYDPSQAVAHVKVLLAELEQVTSNFNGMYAEASRQADTIGRLNAELHVTTYAQHADGWKAFCDGCTMAAGDYVWPCTAGRCQLMPGLLADGAVLAEAQRMLANAQSRVSEMQERVRQGDVALAEAQQQCDEAREAFRLKVQEFARETERVSILAARLISRGHSPEGYHAQAGHRNSCGDCAALAKALLPSPSERRVASNLEVERLLEAAWVPSSSDTAAGQDPYAACGICTTTHCCICSGDAKVCPASPGHPPLSDTAADEAKDELDGRANDEIMNAWRITRHLVQDIRYIKTKVVEDLEHPEEAMPMYETLTSIRAALSRSLRRVEGQLPADDGLFPSIPHAELDPAVEELGARRLDAQLADFNRRAAAEARVLQTAKAWRLMEPETGRPLAEQAALITAVDVLAGVGVPAATPGGEVEYLVWSHDAQQWWGPNGAGYTHRLHDAGRYNHAEAVKACGMRTWSQGAIPPEVMVLAPPADLLDAMKEAHDAMPAAIQAETMRRIAERKAAGPGLSGKPDLATPTESSAGESKVDAAGAADGSGGEEL